ncbi:MAG: tetratricopeptide repeat protein [Puniceicoccaceae bacterium]|nr:tetratricopeptide repeat protein [Puniceicoccaceae bacterium]
MLNANFKSLILITLITISVWLGGCKSPEEKKDAKIKDALSLSEKGSNAEALKILEELATKYPDDIVILKSIGLIYKADGDADMASLFLEQAYLQSPDDTELLFQTYQSLDAAKQPASNLLEKLAEQAPEAMTPELWTRLGQARQEANQVQPALEAFLKGVDPGKAKPAPESAAAIGQLFVKVGNLPQAESWLKIAADSDDPNAMTALFDLLEINLRQNNWADAEATIAQLDTQFPGAVEASQWQQARQELVRWRESQEEMKATLAKAQANKKAIETEARSATVEIETSQVVKSDEDFGRSETAITEDKAQIIADMEAAEAMADAPAIEIAEEADDIIENNKSPASDPSITLDTTNPKTTAEVDYSQVTTVEETALEPAPTPVVEAFPTLEAEPATVTLPPSNPPQTVEELMADAETATLDRDFKSAIRKYWTAISIANNRAEVWNLLSRAYLVDGQLNNAETTALEAVRLEPRRVAYTLDYLRVAQRSLAPEDFLAELETAYARFPVSPEITLSIARGHELISQDRSAARNLYLRFIDIAPNHPLIPQAQNAVARLR